MIFRRAVELRIGDLISIEEKFVAIIYIRGRGNYLLLGINNLPISEIAVSMDDYFEISIKSLAQKAIDLQNRYT